MWSPAIVLIGPMGCGKTTIGTLLAARLDWRFADGDDFHPSANVAKMQTGIPREDEDCLPWLEILGTMIREVLQADGNLILACSALKAKYRHILGIEQQQVCSVFLQGREALLQERIARRTHPYMNKGLLASQLATLEKPTDGIAVSIDRQPEVIVEEIIRRLGLAEAGDIGHATP